MQSSSQVTCLCVCAGPGALHFSAWRCFAGPLLAEAEGVPGIFAEGGLPGGGWDSQRSPLWLFNINLFPRCCALELFLKAAVGVAVGGCSQAELQWGFSCQQRTT